MAIDILSDEMRCAVWAHLPAEDLARCNLVCKGWYQSITPNQPLWKSLLPQKYISTSQEVIQVACSINVLLKKMQEIIQEKGNFEVECLFVGEHDYNLSAKRIPALNLPLKKYQFVVWNKLKQASNISGLEVGPGYKMSYAFPVDKQELIWQVRRGIILSKVDRSAWSTYFDTFFNGYLPNA